MFFKMGSRHCGVCEEWIHRRTAHGLFNYITGVF